MDQTGRIYLNKEEQTFLMEWLETEDIVDAADKFAYLLTLERCDPMKIQEYLKLLMARVDKLAVGKK